MLILQYILLFVILAAALAGTVCLCAAFFKREPSSLSEQTDRFSRAVRLGWPVLEAVFLAVFLFWVVQTALERRVGLGVGTLFSFMADGQPLPGKLAILCAILLVCLGAFLTPGGEKLRHRLNAACEKDWVRWAVSAAVTALFVLWASRVTVFSFMTNDDTSILKAIARIPEQGLASASSAFSNILFCGLIGLFYRIAPGGYWYTWYHLAALSVSFVIIGRCILVKTQKRGWPVLIGCLIHSLMCGGIFTCTLAELSFTVTPAVVGTAAISLILCRSDTDKTVSQVLSDVLSVLLMLLCYLQRQSTGTCLLCFWGLAVAYQLLKILLRRGARWKSQLLSLGLCSLATLVLIAAGKTVNWSNAYTDPEYQTAEHYRSVVMDYLIENLSDEQLEAAGIPRELATLLRGWYFMDERISTETFQTITEMYYTESPSDSPGFALHSVLTCISDLIDAVKSDGQMLPLALCAVFLTLLSAVAFVYAGRSYWPEFLCALCSLGGAVILALYLVWQGRFPLRVFLVVVLPAIVVILLMALSVPDKPISTSQKRRRGAAVAAGLIGLSVCACCGVSLSNVPYATEYATRETLFARQWTIEEYANEHSDTYFVTSFLSENLDPMHGGQYPSNMGLWGGTGVTASSSRLYAEDFFRDDIGFMCQAPSYVMFLLQYLTLEHGPVQAALTDQLIDLVCVYDVSQVTPGDHYTGWYEQNGLTYYFEDGQALTGTHTIDGVEYEFAPAGAEATLTVYPSEDGLIYTTTAYTLIATGE